MNLRLKLLADYYLGGIVHVLLKPIVIFLGKVLKRDHSLEDFDEVAIVKLLGGGSLIIAYPSLLALKEKYPNIKLKLITSPSVNPFGELTGLFDEIIIIRDNGLLNLAIDSVRAIRRTWRIKVMIDLEIHSRLSSIFTLLTCSINRIGVFTDLSFWRRSLYTHLVFYNKYSAVYSMYDHVVSLLGVRSIDFASARAKFREQIGRGDLPRLEPGKRAIGIAPVCSDLGGERMLSPEQWSAVLGGPFSGQNNVAFYFIGGRQDGEFSKKIISSLHSALPQAEFHDCCGKYSLGDSVKLISQLEVLYCIDSSPIHFARLLGIKTISFWGPTAPEMRLRPDPQLQEESNYVRLSCSPCIHVAFEPPCHGHNICMAAAICAKNYAGERNPLWLSKH